MGEPQALPAPAYIYVIGAEDGPQKIGVASEPAKRLALLQTGHWLDLRVAVAVAVRRDIVFAVEQEVHRALNAFRIRR